MPRLAWPTLLTLLAVLVAVLLAIHAFGAPAYSRREWLPAWTTGQDPAHPCRDTRQLVLARDARPGVPVPDEAGAIVFKGALRWSEDGCRVVAGTWVDEYSGQVVTDPGQLDIDHRVPLGEAARRGGSAWSVARKRLYANSLSYRGHLVPVLASENRGKGDKGPDLWQPPSKQDACRYAERWATIKVLWGLRVTESERAALWMMVAAC